MAVKSKFYVATPSGWVEANFGGTGSGSFYGVSSESSNTRTVALNNDDGNFELVAGATVNVKFTSASSTGTMTLNVKETGAKTIMGGGGLTPTWTAGSIINFIYDDAPEDGAWVMQTNFAIVNGIIDVIETNSENIVELQGGMDQMQNTMGQIQEGFVGINNRITQLENSGAVKSVGLEAPTGFSVTNSPITTSGTIKLSFATGYSLPTTANQTNWNTAYGWGNHATKGYLTQGALNDAINNTPWVSYEEQELTATQKMQVRKNIGAGTSSFSGSYTDLTNKPTIPTVNNATLTIQKNGSNVATFTANASSNATANITVPTKVSDLTDSGNYATQTWVTNQGYSKLTIGTTATTAAAGNHTQSGTTIIGPPEGLEDDGPLLLANKGAGSASYWVDKADLLNGYATQTWVNNQKYSKLTLGSTAGTAAEGNHNHDTTYADKNHTHSGFSPISHSHSAKEILPVSEVDDYILVSQINDDPVWCSPSDLGLATQTWVNNQKYSKLELGTTSTTAAKGDHTHSNILTTAPTSANTSGEMRFVVLSSEPNARYSGYLYIITG